MSNIRLLPVSQLNTGVQKNEDWTLSLTFTLSDGVSSINLHGLSFSALIGDNYTVAGDISGSQSTTVTFFAPKSDVSTWLAEVYPFSIVATATSAGNQTLTQDILGYSTFTVGAPRKTQLKPLPTSDTFNDALAFVVPPGFSPQEIMTSFPNLQLGDSLPPPGLFCVNGSGFLTLAIGGDIQFRGFAIGQAILAELPNRMAGAETPAPGYFYINDSGFVVLSTNLTGLTLAVPASPLTAQGVLADLPNLAGGDGLPDAGLAYTGSSGFVAFAQSG